MSDETGVTEQKVKAKVVAPPLSEALALVDKTFSIKKMLADEGKSLIETYYKQSRYGYEKVHSEDASMHVALIDGSRYDPSGFYAQPEAVSQAITALGAKRVLELGCGQAFNARYLAARHPDVTFVGLDLLPAHVERATERAAAKGLANVTFRQGSYEDIPADLGSFDIIFAVETLCYSGNPDAVGAGVMRHLRPGGQFLMHDGFRKPNFDSFPEDMQLAQRLYEVGVVVPKGFFPEGAWQDVLARAGMVDVQTTDLTRQTRAGLRRLFRIGLRFLNNAALRMAAKMMPTYMARNAVSGLLGIYIIVGDNPEAPDFDKGTLSYQLITARKPG